MEAATVMSVTPIIMDVPAPVGADPMALRWGLNAIVRDKYLEGQRCGAAIAALPYGRWFPITRFNTTEEIHSTDEAMARERVVTRSAESAQKYLEEVLAGKNDAGDFEAGKADWGFQVGFFEDTDAAKMAVLSTLLPTMTEIRTLAQSLNVPSPISARCEGDDDLNYIGDRENCPSCRLKWITSELCTVYISKIVQNGLEVQETHPITHESEMRVVRPSIDEFRTARLLTEQALTIGIGSLQKQWAELAGELEKNERRNIGDYQHRIRKDIHQAKPQDRQLEVVREYANANKGGDNSALLASLAEGQMQISQLLARLMNPDNPTPPSTGVVLTPAQERMAKARAARGQNKEEETV